LCFASASVIISECCNEMLQNSAIKIQLLSGAELPGDQADAKKLRKRLLRNTDSSVSTNTAEDDDDADTEVSNNISNKWTGRYALCLLDLCQIIGLWPQFSVLWASTRSRFLSSIMGAPVCAAVLMIVTMVTTSI